MRIGVYPHRLGDGIGTYCVELAAALAARDHDVVALGTEEPDDPSIEWVDLGAAPGRQPLRNSFHRARELDWVRTTYDFDVFHAAGGVPLAFMRETDNAVANAWFYPPSLLCGIPTRYHSQPGRFPSRLGTLAQQLQYHAMDPVAYRRADMVVAVTDVLREALESMQCHPIHVPPGLNPEEIRESVPEPEPGSPNTLVFAASDVSQPRKGFENMLDGLARLGEREVAFTLHVAGGGVDWGEARVEERGLGDHVEFHGPVPRADLLALYRRATAAVVPSVYEEFGYVVLEAMAQGTPVVGSDIHAFEQLLRSGAGVLTRPSEPEQFADDLHRLLADTSLRRAVASKALVRAREEYSMDVVVPELTAVYESVADGY
jgi:glycosyltransferase involved in cell wall biosynthesis